MKSTSPTKGKANSEKKPSDSTLMAPAADAGREPVKARPAFGVPPTAAVWSRYIDSRMKHFGTR